MRGRLLFLLVFSLLTSACAGHYAEIAGPKPEATKTGPGVPLDSYEVNGERYYPLPDSMGFVETGRASWYGADFHGKPTSSGETYDMYKKTAAHKTLPLGTYVKVLNLENNESTIVRINDRGPFVKGRIIDLSFSAASDIHMASPGLAEVKVIALGREIGEALTENGERPVLDLRDFETGEFTVQIGAFRNRNNALNLADRLKPQFDYVNVVEYVDARNQTFFRVHISRSTSLVKAAEFEKKLEGMGFTEAFVLRI
jgi:rare lipoprotein A